MAQKPGVNRLASIPVVNAVFRGYAQQVTGLYFRQAQCKRDTEDVLPVGGVILPGEPVAHLSCDGFPIRLRLSLGKGFLQNRGNFRRCATRHHFHQALAKAAQCDAAFF